MCVFIGDLVFFFFLLRMSVQFVCPFIEQIICGVFGVCLILGYFILFFLKLGTKSRANHSLTQLNPQPVEIFFNVL